MKRHEILKRTYREAAYYLSDVLIGEGAEDYKERIQSGNVGQGFDRLLRIANVGDAAVYQHLEYGNVPDLKGVLSSVLDMITDYLYGDWWNFPGNDEDAIALDKTRKDRDLNWFAPIVYGIFVGGLLQRWKDVKHIVEWIDEVVIKDVEKSKEPDHIHYLFLCVSCYLQGIEHPRQKQWCKAISSGKEKYVKLCLQVWDAVVAGNQPEFNKTFPECVKYYLKHEADNSPIVTSVSIHASILWLIAEKNGMQWPVMDEKLEAGVVRRQTIGLA